MKRGLILVVFLSYLISFVSAQNTCSSPDQIILRLSEEDNAHGEVWNGANGYTTEICFSGAAPSNPHSCSGNNNVLRLAAPTNAHAEGPTGSYGTQICYGTLSCRITAVGGSCNAGETFIVSLSATTNAHLAEDNSYPYDICCTAGPVTPPVIPIGVQWLNMINEAMLPEPDGKVYVGNTIKLVAFGVPDAPGSNPREVIFEIFDDDGVGDDDIRTGSNALRAFTDPSTNTAEVIWTITQADYDAGKGDELSGSPELELQV